MARKKLAYQNSFPGVHLAEGYRDVDKHDHVADDDSKHVWLTLTVYLVFDGALRKKNKKSESVACYNRKVRE